MNGKRLRLARKNAGFTQAKLAEALFVSQSLITAWESGARDPGSEMIARLATDPAQIPRVSSQPHPEEQIAALEAQLAEVRRRKARLLDLYATETALTPSELSGRINPLSEQEGRLQGEIEALRASSGVDEKKAATLVATFADVIASGDPARIRTLVESLIDRIDLDGSQLTIRWRF